MRILKLSLISTLLAGLGSAVATDRDYSELFESAVEAVTWDFEETWAYTETTSGGDGEYAARYDPRLPEDRRWTLLSIDGREPTEAEAAQFLKDKNEDLLDEEIDEDYDEDDGNDVDSMVDPGTLQLVEETDDYWLLSFVPTDLGQRRRRCGTRPEDARIDERHRKDRQGRRASRVYRHPQYETTASQGWGQDERIPDATGIRSRYRRRANRHEIHGCRRQSERISRCKGQRARIAAILRPSNT